MQQTIQDNASVLEKELNWLNLVISTRLKLYLQQPCDYQSIFDIEAPAIEKQDTLYYNFVGHYQLSVAERLILLLSLAPHVKPEALDAFLTRNKDYNKRFTEFGGIVDKDHGNFYPTGETALFLLAGNKLEDRFAIQYIFDADHFFAQHHILKIGSTDKEKPFLTGRLALSQEYIDRFTLGKVRKPDYSIDFPAKLVTTEMEWEEVVLRPGTLEEVMEIQDWIDYGPVLMNGAGLGKKLKPGYKCLFYGASGTGKTLTACLLGKTTQRDVYRIDLSLMVSKYIGETEKNLAKVFDQAENKNWILFFDEADALFGKRSETKDAHDRYANQEVAYLLQRIEDFPGIVILATNLKDNIDEAFTRRFQAIIPFPSPNKDERYKLWQKSFSPVIPLEETIDLRKIAVKHDVTGGVIMNVIRYCSIRALKKETPLITLSDLEKGIKKELQKSGIVIV